VPHEGGFIEPHWSHRLVASLLSAWRYLSLAFFVALRFARKELCLQP
jgi:hypothetical protein